MLETLRELVGNRYAVAGLLVVGGLIGGWIAAFVIERTVGVLVRRTETDLDDKIMEALHRPLVLSVVLFGLALAVDVLKIPDKPHAYTISAIIHSMEQRADFHGRGARRDCAPARQTTLLEDLIRVVLVLDHE